MNTPKSCDHGCEVGSEECDCRQQSAMKVVLLKEGQGASKLPRRQSKPPFERIGADNSHVVTQRQ
jgi:hypothetical protein